MQDRSTPYTKDEQRVADWLVARSGNTVGAGDDPIGFLLASYEMMHQELVLKRKLWEVCEKFIQDQDITCSESVYQTDRVIINAYEFIEEVCNVVGYVEQDE